MTANDVGEVVQRTVTRSNVCSFASDANLTQSLGKMSNQGLKPTLTGERSVNSVTLIGRLGRDPEARGTEERPVTLLSMATSVNFKTQEGTYIQKTEWHRVSVFAPVIREMVIRTVGKGDRVYVQGSLSYSTYQNQSGETVKAANIIANEVIVLSRKQAMTDGGQPEAGALSPTEEYIHFEDEKPSH